MRLTASGAHIRRGNGTVSVGGYHHPCAGWLRSRSVIAGQDLTWVAWREPGLKMFHFSLDVAGLFASRAFSIPGISP
jgi:hypothetical protein